ncbi:hypothetical protein Lal_00025273 [Lupinus albus]|nr:hypothetical protein Lal_00025273 [Lupinus albus]
MHPSLSFSLVLCFIVTNLHCFALSSTNNQDGILAQSPKAPEQSFLQKHAAFFDRNHDGIIYPKETFEGFFGLSLPY